MPSFKEFVTSCCSYPRVQENKNSQSPDGKNRSLQDNNQGKVDDFQHVKKMPLPNTHKEQPSHGTESVNNRLTGQASIGNVTSDTLTNEHDQLSTTSGTGLTDNQPALLNQDHFQPYGERSGDDLSQSFSVSVISAAASNHSLASFSTFKSQLQTEVVGTKKPLPLPRKSLGLPLLNSAPRATNPESGNPASSTEEASTNDNALSQKIMKQPHAPGGPKENTQYAHHAHHAHQLINELAKSIATNPQEGATGYSNEMLSTPSETGALPTPQPRQQSPQRLLPGDPLKNLSGICGCLGQSMAATSCNVRQSTPTCKLARSYSLPAQRPVLTNPR